MVALYVGGMGHPKANFHKDQMVRRGYPEEAQRIEELFLAGRREEAIAAVPDQYVDDGGLIGPPDRIRERFRPWIGSGATGLTLHTREQSALELVSAISSELS
jgi:hypothetical protein